MEANQLMEADQSEPAAVVILDDIFADIKYDRACILRNACVAIQQPSFPPSLPPSLPCCCMLSCARWCWCSLSLCRCEICGKTDGDEDMLLCGSEDGTKGCGLGHHTYCLDPPLDSIPEGDWFCDKCLANDPTLTRTLDAAAPSTSRPPAQQADAIPTPPCKEDRTQPAQSHDLEAAKPVDGVGCPSASLREEGPSLAPNVDCN